MAEREGFEPPIPVKVWPLSRRLVSTTHAPLRARLQLARVASPFSVAKVDECVMHADRDAALGRCSVGPIYGTGLRRSRKKVCSRSMQRAAKTPEVTSTRWLSLG